MFRDFDQEKSPQNLCLVDFIYQPPFLSLILFEFSHPFDISESQVGLPARLCLRGWVSIKLQGPRKEKETRKKRKNPQHRPVALTPF
jgi:hypothetical protein